MRNKRLFLLLLMVATLSVIGGYAQSKYRILSLPPAINSVNEEFSGMTLWKNRLYLAPQYGDHKETKLDGAFNLYSINADSIGRVIDRKDTALTAYRTIKVYNLNLLPDSIKKYYEGFEAITITNNRVYLSIETTDTYAYCFLLKGTLDTVKNELHIDPKHYISLKRQLFITNAGFESVTYLPKENKLLAYYEFNATATGGIGFLIDPSFKKAPQKIKAPFLYFRITDIAATKNDRIYGINYFYNGDYNYYLDNKIVHRPEQRIKQTIPDLRDSLDRNPDYLKGKRTTYARIITLDNYKSTQWKQVAAFDGYKNNWEGIALYRKGALVVTDANRSSKQLNTFAYIEF
jgi:hypothetical protein